MKNKKLIADIIAIIAVCAAAALIIIIINVIIGSVSNQQTETTAATSASESASTAAQTAAPETAADTTAQEPHTHGEEAEQHTTVNIALPTSGGEITHFSGTYVPDGKAEDIATGKAVPMRELFGAGYTGSAITFNEDGTFTDTLVASVPKNGKYNVEDGVITAVYLPDESLDITVTEWDGETGAPVSFCVVYTTVGDRGYRVFFTEKA